VSILRPTAARTFSSYAAGDATSPSLSSDVVVGNHHADGHHHLPPQLDNCSLDVLSDSYVEAYTRTQRQVEELELKLEAVAKGGGDDAVRRHKNRRKMLPRERIEKLVDVGTPILELSALAGCCEDNDNILSGGIVTSIGIVSGTPCMIVANDATVKGGTYFPITGN